MIVLRVALILTAASAVVGYCPKQKIQNIGECSYRFFCRGTIRNIRLLDKCMAAFNKQNTIEVTLADAIERFDSSIDPEFLAYITILKISANWTQTQLSLLQFTARLEKLYLSGNHIEKIEGEPFSTLSSLRLLDLSHNKLTEIDHLFRFELKPNQLSVLNLSHNRIRNISADAFAELLSLTELDLSYNSISNLTVEPFSKLINLEILKLNNNSIINLNGAVNNLINLKHLYLKGNHIQNIDEKSLQIIIHLQTFDVSSNNLHQISSRMLSRHFEHFNHAVCRIILSGNNITTIPNATLEDGNGTNRRVARAAVDMLTQVDLSDNNIEKIEYNAFQSLEKLTSLDLSRNKLVYFIISPEDVAYIRYLNLSGNNIRHLYYESFSSMDNLHNLDLSHNKLEYIPDSTFYNNYNLKHVNMTHNIMTGLSRLHISIFHTDGGILDLSHNNLSSLVIQDKEGLRLTVLILKSNNITDPTLINLCYQTDLKELDMSHNYITKLYENSLRLPSSLKSLDLSYNRIDMIAPSTFVRIKHLETLHLAHNRLYNIEYGSFRGLSSLRTLDLSFNLLVYLDSNLLMDLKSLSTLSLRYNRLRGINDEAWYGHKYELKVTLDGNNLTCAWLTVALKNAENGYSKMHPTVQNAYSGPSIEGIPCVTGGNKLELIRQQPSLVLADERLLLTSQKILDAVKSQTFFLRKLIWTLEENYDERKLNAIEP